MALGVAGPSPRIGFIVRGVIIGSLAVALAVLLVERAQDRYFDPRPGNPANHVLVYTTSWCPVCARLRWCLRRHGVPFEERDVESSWRWDREYSAAGGGGVPLTLVGSEVALGLRQQELEPLLMRAGFRVDCWSTESWRDYAAEMTRRTSRPPARPAPLAPGGGGS